MNSIIYVILRQPKAGPGDWGGVGRVGGWGAGGGMKHFNHGYGPCLAMNEHPRGDTDVILRQPKAPIEIFNSR